MSDEPTLFSRLEALVDAGYVDDHSDRFFGEQVLCLPLSMHPNSLITEATARIAELEAKNAELRDTAAWLRTAAIVPPVGHRWMT